MVSPCAPNANRLSGLWLTSHFDKIYDFKHKQPFTKVCASTIALFQSPSYPVTFVAAAFISPLSLPVLPLIILDVNVGLSFVYVYTPSYFY